MRAFIAMTLLCISTTLLSQNITGKITDSKGEVLPFANVSIKNSKKGTTADENGNFTIKDVNIKKSNCYCVFYGVYIRKKIHKNL